MKTSRLEAFSDGVIAIIITIMVLELKVPEHLTPVTLLAQWPVLLSYALSFALGAIYWINHHYLLHFAKSVSRSMLWANMNWLFWLSLMPFATAGIGHSPNDPFVMNVYGVVQLMCALSYKVLLSQVFTPDHPDVALGRIYQKKGRLSLILYALAIPMAWVHPRWSFGIYIGISIGYIIPSKAFQHYLAQTIGHEDTKSS